MAKIRLTKEFSFEMAHALDGYDGKCKNIHGHSYEFKVTVIGEPVKDENSPKNGMVMDFGDLKHIVKEAVVDRFDHALMLKKSDTSEKLIGQQYANRLVLVDFQPTCENMLDYFAKEISKRLPANIQLHSLFLRETPTSFAEWYASDN
ncbi:MAG TPA: 6-carboxytetrahydropterin synthase QueD [Flavobacteriales bacterium]|nr:6-carboxytetrahydropterin synthase QueD [Flavobacteriales bacterium]|tara:strand:- start:2450 stop:2893 length:444 start_codon:yes stop_codon:yes gene_type:complete